MKTNNELKNMIIRQCGMYLRYVENNNILHTNKVQVYDYLTTFQNMCYPVLDLIDNKDLVKIYNKICLESVKEGQIKVHFDMKAYEELEDNDMNTKDFLELLDFSKLKVHEYTNLNRDYYFEIFTYNDIYKNLIISVSTI